MSHRLFIFISNRLREREYLSLSDDETDVLVIQEGLLSVKKEPPKRSPPFDPWETELKSIIAEKIRSYEHWKRSRIRVAGHLETCFGALPNMGWRKDRRFPEKEARLGEELGHEIDIQIWGFHHEAELSEIWTVVRQVKGVLEDPLQEAKTKFFNALEQAFQRACRNFESTSVQEERQKTWETFSLLKHDILGLFDPLRIRLETAREIKGDDPSRAREIGSRVQASLKPKLEQALILLTEREPDVGGTDAAEWLRRAGAQLEAQPDLSEFDEWLNQLDDCLDNLRNSVTE